MNEVLQCTIPIRLREAHDCASNNAITQYKRCTESTNNHLLSPLPHRTISTMKSVCVALALVGSASAFVTPMANVRVASTSAMAMSTSEPMSRSQAISTVFASGAAAVAAAAVPSAAFADGAKSLATQARSRGVYGARIEALKPAVEKGDSAQVLSERNVFTLFNSGVYSTDKKKRQEANELAKAVVAAASAGDKGALKTSFAAYVKFTEKKSGYSGAGDGQGFGSEFDYKNRTPSGTVYQR